MGVMRWQRGLMVAILSAPALIAYAQPSQTEQSAWDCSGPWHMWGGDWGWWWTMPLLFMLLMFGACSAVTYFIGHRLGAGHCFRRWATARGEWNDAAHTALQILNKRYATGEIQKQEYEEKKATLLAGR